MARTTKVGFLITGDSKGAVKAVNLTEKELSKLDKTTSGLGKKFSDSSAKIISGFSSMAEKAARWGAAATLAAGAVGAALVKAGLQSVDSLAKTADKLGVTTEALASLRFAAEQTGVETNKFDAALQRFTRRLADAAAGTGPAVDAFKALGLSAGDLVELEPDKAFAKVAEQMNKVENQSQRVSLAFKLFDSEGVDLVNTLRLGSDGLAAMAEEAEVLGLTLSRVDAAKVEQANDAMNRINKAFGGLGQQLAAKVAPVLTLVAERMFGVTKEAGGMGEVATKVFNVIIKGAGHVANAIAGIQVAWLEMKIVFQRVALAIVENLDNWVRALIELYNKIPFLDDVVYTADLRGFAETFESEIEEGRRRVDEILLKPLPSEALENFVNTAERQYGDLADSVVASQDAIQGEVLDTATVTESLTKTTKKETKEIASAWDKALQDTAARIDQTFAQAFKDAFTGTLKDFGDFAKAMKDAFLNLLAELAYIATVKPIVMNIAAGFGLGTAASGASASTLLGGGLSGITSGLGTLGTRFYEGIANAAGGLGLSGIEGLALDKAIGTSPLSFGLDIGGGLLGGLASNQVFGSTSGLGNLAGGIAGSLLIPIPGVGSAVGSFLGGGLESLLGFGKNNGNNAGRATIDLSNGTLNVTGIGKSFDQANVDAAGRIAQSIQQLSVLLGGSSAAFDVKVGNRFGIKVDGQKFASEAEAIEYAFEKILNSATALDPVVRDLALAFEGTVEEAITFAVAMQDISERINVNPVDQAVQDFTAAQEAASRTLQESYNKQLQAMHFLAGGFDGSAEAASTLANGLAATQKAAYDFALAIQAIGQSTATTVEEQTRYFAESVMTRQELIRSQRSERNELIRDLQSGAITDPQQIDAAVARILELNRLLFDALPEEERRKQVEDYTRIADNVGEKAGSLLDQALADAQAGQEKLNQDLERILFTAAADFQRPADTMQSAASSFAAWVLQLQKNGIPVTLDYGTGGGGSEVTA